MIPVCQPTVLDSDQAAVLEVLKSRWLSTGAVVTQFEQALAERTGYPHAVALSSCTAALFLALRAHRIGPGDVVGVPALTFTATAAAVEHAGARVKFLDVDPKTWLLGDVNLTGCDAVIPVDLYGQLVPRPLIQEWKMRDLVVIEDAAHAIGADLGGEADAVCLSFYATKNITTCGEGGALLTKDARIASEVRRMSLHGLSSGAWSRYDPKHSNTEHSVMTLGYKANMTDIQAAMGLAQLAHLNEWRSMREGIAQRYDRALQMEHPPRHPSGIAHLYPVLSEDRDRLAAELRDQGIGTGLHYRSLTEEPYWRRLNAHCPVAEQIGRSVISLPLYPHLNDEDQHRVIEAAREFAPIHA